MTSICFLFNHYFPHQVPHAVPYAFELSLRVKDIHCVIACSSMAEMEFVKKISIIYPGHTCSFVLLRVPGYYRLIDPFFSMWTFRRKKMILRNNLNFFKTFDAIVAPERNFLNLKTRYGIRSPKFIHCRHGAGDRAGGFDPRLKIFDFILLPGQKIADRLKDLGYLEKGRYAVVGYPKFEVVRGLQKERKRIFSNNNPVVVYNPHFDQVVSSWGIMGIKVLDFFSRHPEWNLIFAPHVVLFKRKRRHNAYLPRKFYNIPNIYVDLGSDASADMTYMLAADIYLGDVSSQVYEFLLKPRPCIFLNAHKIKWKGNPYYYHWNLGQVVNNVELDLEAALKQAFSSHSQYLDKQKKAFNYTFYNESGSTAAERGAKAIATFLKIA